MSKHNGNQSIDISNLTPDALEALEKAGFTRRSFLKGTGALIVSFSMAGVADKLGVVSAATVAQGDPRDRLDSWIAIASDGRVLAYAGKVELGQGMYTVQTQLVAEELLVPISKVTLLLADTQYAPGIGTPDQGTTSGSQSHPTNFNPSNRSLMTAGATAREALFQMAAQRLNVDVDQLTAYDGVISVKTDASKQVTYAELVGGQAFNLPMNPNATPRDPKDWTVMGTPVQRLEVPNIVTARHEYVYNVRVPGMVHGRVARPPFVGGTFVSIDNQAEVESMPGNVKVVQRGNFVGVVADQQWQAVKAVEALKVTWAKPSNPLPDHGTFYEWMRGQSTQNSLTVNSGDVDAKLASAAKVISATYYHPYNMHAGMGASCAVADIKGTGDNATGTLWSPTQALYNQRDGSARVLGIPAANLRVIYRQGSGCYGITGADTVSYDAVILSQAVGKPVRVQLTRKDEMAWENYGPAFVIDQRVGIDAEGNIIAWDHEAWTLSKGGRPSGTNPGNVVTGDLVGLPGQRTNPTNNTPNPPNNFGNGSNHAPSYVAGCGASGNCAGTGAVRSERVLVHTMPSPFFTGPLRSPARLQNTFAHESFMDEVASAVGADPVEYRLRHLNNVSADEEISGTRLQDVVRAAARLANWEARPSPKPGNSRTGVVTGRGMACCLYEGDNGYCALVAEVEVDQDTGRVTAKKFFGANDSGPISNPNGLANQVEGGIYQGMSRALREEVTWDDEKVTSFDWITYPVLSFGIETPEIQVELINRTNVDAMGAGETTITIVGAAIANAIFDATGVRIRQLPLTPERVKAALDARE